MSNIKEYVGNKIERNRELQVRLDETIEREYGEGKVHEVIGKLLAGEGGEILADHADIKAAWNAKCAYVRHNFHAIFHGEES